MRVRQAPLGPDEVAFTPEHGALYLLLKALVDKRRLDGTECSEIGHDLASTAHASCWEIDFRRVLSLWAVCRACEKPVTVTDQLSLLKFKDPRLLERAERDVLRELKKKLRAADRNRKDTHGAES